MKTERYTAADEAAVAQYHRELASTLQETTSPEDRYAAALAAALRYADKDESHLTGMEIIVSPPPPFRYERKTASVTEIASVTDIIQQAGTMAMAAQSHDDTAENEMVERELVA